MYVGNIFCQNEFISLVLMFLKNLRFTIYEQLKELNRGKHFSGAQL